MDFNASFNRVLKAQEAKQVKHREEERLKAIELPERQSDILFEHNFPETEDGKHRGINLETFTKIPWDHEYARRKRDVRIPPANGNLITQVNYRQRKK